MLFPTFLEKNLGIQTNYCASLRDVAFNLCKIVAKIHT